MVSRCSARTAQRKTFERAKFCIQCAARLRRACPKCCFENPPEARFCAQCATALTEAVAAPLAKAYLARDAAAERAYRTIPRGAPGPVLQTSDDAAAPANGERRTATALFADIRVSTELEQDLESEETREMIAEIYGWFTESFDTADLKDAKALLDELGA
jgi:hypothetical protein